MKTQQQHFVNKKWDALSSSADFNPGKAQLVLAFGSNELITNKDIFDYLKQVQNTSSNSLELSQHLKKILSEDKSLLQRLAE